MIDKKSYKKAIATPLERAGFTKKGQSWYIEGQDAIVGLNLQKNDWGEEYFMNLEIWIKGLGENEFPPKGECHLSFRVEQLFPNERELIREGSSLDKSNVKMLAQLSEFVSNELIPFIIECTNEVNLQKFMINGTFKYGLIRKDARIYLGRNN